MKNKFILCFGVLAASFAVAVFAAEKPASSSATKGTAAKTNKLSAKDKTFMLEAGKGGQMEVNWGKLAAQNGQSGDVKKFGNRMITDHSKWNNELMALAKEEGVTVPTVKSSGKWKSDKDYMDDMVQDHTKDLAAFQDEAQNGSDPDLKKWADKTAKGVKKHLDMAKEVQAKLK
jgi:putative membrane protein